MQGICTFLKLQFNESSDIFNTWPNTQILLYVKHIGNNGQIGHSSHLCGRWTPHWGYSGENWPLIREGVQVSTELSQM